MNELVRMGRYTGMVARSLIIGMAAALLLAVAGAQEATTPASAAAHDYPTYERVRYVLQCIERNGAGDAALVYQCSCAIDKLAERFSIDDYVEMQTAVNGSSIAGERGGALRDNPALRVDARHYREAEAAALKSCGVPSKH